ncbi:Gfo/Idh/MocA family oxidoreductase [Candidatus Poribacteria bacterium]|nr:Gfo/Idh/MocA family oxidoreductase [Candidatus Poribacteria bacterium]
MGDKLRVGIIGPGGAGRGNTMGFATRDDCDVVAAADVSPNSIDALEDAMEERVDGYSRGTLARYTGEYEYSEMLDKEDLDIVGVFSPHSMHDIQVKAAMRAGCSVIVEKPMANYVGDAILMHKMAVALGVHLVGGYQRHYEPRYITGREVIQSGQIGELERFEVYLTQRWGGGGWRGTFPRNNVGFYARIDLVHPRRGVIAGNFFCNVGMPLFCKFCVKTTTVMRYGKRRWQLYSCNLDPIPAALIARA